MTFWRTPIKLDYSIHKKSCFTGVRYTTVKPTRYLTSYCRLNVVQGWCHYKTLRLAQVRCSLLAGPYSTYFGIGSFANARTHRAPESWILKVYNHRVFFVISDKIDLLQHQTHRASVKVLHVYL